MKWAQESTVIRVEKPTNLATARNLGYKAKQGYVIARVQVGKGRRARKHPRGGRKPAKNIKFIQPQKSLQAIGEEKVARKFLNLEVLNSYWVGESGTTKFFEVILIDPDHPCVDITARQRGRAFRGLTSAGKKHRGL